MALGQASLIDDKRRTGQSDHHPINMNMHSAGNWDRLGAASDSARHTTKLIIPTKMWNKGINLESASLDAGQSDGEEDDFVANDELLSR